MITMDRPRTTSPFPSQSRTHQFNPSPAIVSGERTHPQWTHQETVKLISIRGELERDFTASKRNKALWEAVSSRMRDEGYSRTPEQCKCKWKNLVNRYKGKETSDPDSGRQCPFFEELHAVFSESAKNLRQSLMESEQSRKRKKIKSGDQISDDFSQNEDDEGDDSDEESLIRSSNNALKRKTGRDKHMQVTVGNKSPRLTNASFSNINSIQEMLKVFFQEQRRIEMQWRESMERHWRERDSFEQEWRQSMEKLERERLMMEQAWREREEQREMRDEIRAEKRDALLTTLLNKLISEDHL